MGKFGKWLKKSVNKVAAVGADLGKGIAKVAASPVNALTGQEYDPKMKTGFGKALEKAGDFVEDVQASAVNTATLGLAKKIGVADGERETKAGKVVGTLVGIGGLAVSGLAGAGALAGSGILGSTAAGVVAGKTAVGGGLALLSGSGVAKKAIDKGLGDLTKTGGGKKEISEVTAVIPGDVVKGGDDRFQDDVTSEVVNVVEERRPGEGSKSLLEEIFDLIFSIFK